MKPIEQQIVLASLNELMGEINQCVTDPQLQGRLDMIRFLLAYAYNQGGQATYRNIDEELAAITETAAKVQQTLAAKPQDKPDGVLNAAQLTPYLRTKFNDPDISVTQVKSLLGGVSKFTYIVEMSGGNHDGEWVVVRHDLAGGPVESKSAEEFDILKLVYEKGVTVAEPLWGDNKPPFGGTCLVTRKAPGETAFDVTGAKLKEDSADAARALAKILAKTHSIPIADLPLPKEQVDASLEACIRQIVELFDDQLQRRHVSSSPTLKRAFEWLYDNIPSGRPPSLVHGDASLRNLLVHNTEASAMLDWELWHIGDHNEDLAYCRRDVEPAMGWEAFLAEYYRHGGKEYDEFAGEYFLVFGAVRNAVFAENCLHSFIKPAPVPEPKLAYGPLLLGIPLVVEVADRLKKLGVDLD